MKDVTWQGLFWAAVVGCATFVSVAHARDIRCTISEASYAPPGGGYRNTPPQVKKIRIFDFDETQTDRSFATSLDWESGAHTEGFLSLLKREDYPEFALSREIGADDSDLVLVSHSSDATVEVSLTTAPERTAFGYIQYTVVLFRKWQSPGIEAHEREMSVGDCVYR